MLAAVLATGSLAASVGTPLSPAGAVTDPTTLVGQGGSFLEPVMSKLLTDDAPNIGPLFGAFTQTDDNSGVAAFVGLAAGQYSADFAVTERPLTAKESGQAKTDGRAYAYIPFAATPVAIATLVPTFDWEQSGNLSIGSNDFCQHIPLTTTALGEVLGLDATSPLNHWNDARIDCPEAGGGTKADGLPIHGWANLDPSMANDATISLLDSAAQSKSYFDAALKQPGSLTTDDTPSEAWPLDAGDTIPGGDQPLIGKLLDINSETNAPSTLGGNWQLGAVAPISSVWTGAPLGVPWNLPTAAVQNAQGAFIPPSASAAQAAEADTALASTSDPTTNNLVTFNANSSDAAAYNSYLMVESYLVVPLKGLAAAKASSLAQMVRFVLGPQGQKDIESFGSAPATPGMQTAGLKVAAELSVEAAAGASPAAAAGSTTTTSTAPDSTSTTTTAVDAGAAGGSGDSGAGTSATTGGASGSAAGLAFTGSPHLGTWIGVGVAFMLVGALLRRRFRRREARS